MLYCIGGEVLILATVFSLHFTWTTLFFFYVWECSCRLRGMYRNPILSLVLLVLFVRVFFSFFSQIIFSLTLIRSAGLKLFFIKLVEVQSRKISEQIFFCVFNHFFFLNCFLLVRQIFLDVIVNAEEITNVV